MRFTSLQQSNFQLFPGGWRGSGSPGIIGFWTHDQGEFAAVLDVAVRKPGLVERLAVEGGRLDVLIVRGTVLGFDLEELAFAEVDADVVEQGTAYVVGRDAGRDGVESDGGEDYKG